MMKSIEPSDPSKTDNTLKKEIWVSGSGEVYKKNALYTHASSTVKLKNAKIFVGSDSDISKKIITFCSAICLFGENVPGTYFFTRKKINSKKFPTLISRIFEETRLSLEIANQLVDENKVPLSKIELHLDVSPIGSSAKTSKFSDMLKGYVSGAGFMCRIKPNAWASQTVADKHSK